MLLHSPIMLSSFGYFLFKESKSEVSLITFFSKKVISSSAAKSP